MPAFVPARFLGHQTLQDDFGRLGNTFTATYNERVASVALRPAEQSSQSDNFPSRLVGPDGITFLTGDQRPEYVVMSYTWGRWMRPTRELDTPVKGGHWLVPANDLFTRTELDTAISKIANGANAWVDVLCIPQSDDDPEKEMEIGKQSQIFRSASRASVWLCSGGEKNLAEICSLVPEQSYMIPPDVLAVNYRENIAETRRRLKLIADLTEQVPWTTSLWTLQEAALRLDAIFYGKGGDPIRHERSGNPITVRHLIKTLHQINDGFQRLFLPVHGTSQGILDKPDAWGMSEEDVSYVFKAIDSVNTISLHKLLTMNAGELLLTSKHRVCGRQHDRVYGIMGAIGVVVEVNYREEPTKVMDKFLVALHNRFPSEMQAFCREGTTLPGTRQWLVDEDSVKLTLLRQLAPPLTPIFTDITSTGELTVRELVYVSQSGLAELIARLLTRAVLPALDNIAFMQVTDGAVYHETTKRADDMSYVHLCLILKLVASKAQLGLVSCGTILGMEMLGWKNMYILVGSNEKATQTPAGLNQSFQRLGILIVGDELCADNSTQGTFLIR